MEGTRVERRGLEKEVLVRMEGRMGKGMMKGGWGG